MFQFLLIKWGVFLFVTLVLSLRVELKEIKGEEHPLLLYESFVVLHANYVATFKQIVTSPHIFCRVVGYYVHFVFAQDLDSCFPNVKEIEQTHPSANDEQRVSQTSLFIRHIGERVAIRYVVEEVDR